jgi:calcium-dependent protein kinase
MPAAEGIADKFTVWMSKPAGAPAELHDAYDFDESALIGIGTFGRVLKGTCKATGRSCAIKQISKTPGDHAGMDKQMHKEAVRQEVSCMQKLEHPHIIRLFEHFEDAKTHYLVIELCTGGKLIDFVARLQDFTEGDVSVLMGHVFSALKYMHEQHIVHRDVKPDNMLLESRSPIRENTLKLIDFGLATRCAPGRDVRLSAGTPEFMSPQAIDGRYDSQTDLWSCGVTMFMLLSGYAPFQSQTHIGVFAAVKRGNFNFLGQDWQNISDDAKQLIRALLKMSPQHRCTAEQALDDMWVRQRAPGGDGNSSLQKVINNFRAHSARRQRPQPEADAFQDVRAVLAEVTQWANSLWQGPEAKPSQKSYLYS